GRRRAFRWLQCVSIERLAGFGRLVAFPALPPLLRSALRPLLWRLSCIDARLSELRQRGSLRRHSIVRDTQPAAEQLRDEGGQSEHVGQRRSTRALPRPEGG